MDNVIYIKPFNAAAGTQTNVSICMKNTAEIRSFQFDLYLPEGITAVKSSKGRIQGSLSAGRLPEEDMHSLTFSEHEGGVIRFLCDSEYGDTFTGNDGEIATLQVNISGTMADGDYPIVMKDMKLSEVDIANYYLADDIETTVTIGEADTRVLLDETSTTAPEASDGAVDVRVKRTIKANEWSTICLPFAMSADQITEAFGNNVTWELASFNGYTITEDNDDNIIGITVKFNSATSIAANTPYLIKVSDNVTEFTVDGVEIAPIEEPKVTKGRGKMYGNYVAGTELDYGCLLLSGNQFWYSIGDTKIKAFRGYFDFRDYLTEFEENYSSRIVMSFEDGTGITNTNGTNDTNEWYTVSGVKVEKPVRKGLYINNGHKVVVK